MRRGISLRFWALCAFLTTATTFAAASGLAQEVKWTPIYRGVALTSFEEQEPLRKIVVARVDVKEPGISFVTTEPNPNFSEDKNETVRETTRTFLERNGLALAVNGNYYTPFGGRTITKPGDSNLRGLAVCNGFVESRPEPGFPSFVVKRDGTLEIRDYAVDEDLSDVYIAVSGPAIVLKDGAVVAQDNKDTHPRTAVGFSKNRRYVYFMTIDGRRPEHSVGATLEQVGEALLKVGAFQGLNLDGGGSTTMVARDKDGSATILNWPINAISLDGLRFNGNAIGVTAMGAPRKSLDRVTKIYNDGSPVEWTPTFKGIDLARWTEYDGQLHQVYAARIDMREKGVALKTTPPNADFAFDTRETTRQTTAGFLEATDGVKIAVNANFYSPFNAQTIAAPGDSNLCGLAVCDGVVESKPEKGFPSFIQTKDGKLSIRNVDPEESLDDIRLAVSGNMIVLKGGDVVPQGDKAMHPRTAVGYSADQRYLYLIAIDGRQKDYSVGATYEDVGRALKLCGAWDGLNLDGGGSTTMAVRGDDEKAIVVNRPINGTPDRLRFNANSLGATAEGAILTPTPDGRDAAKK